MAQKLPIAVVFHSVCSNTYLMARRFVQRLEALGADVRLFRLADANYEEVSTLFPSSREYRDEILSLPEISEPTAIMDCRALFLGSPTYFGGVSAPVKAFMDSFLHYWVEGKMSGKYFGCFASASTPQGGADMCLQSMNVFAQHMGMVLLPVPSTVGGAPQPAYGIAHASGEQAGRRIDDAEKQAIDGYCSWAWKVISGQQ